MNVKALDRMNKQPVAGVDYPLFKGKVTVKLHNVYNGKNEVYESHNAPTNAIADLFANNYGGLLNYNNFADLFSTWLGGVLVFENALDPTAVNDYGIPDRISNPCVAHAGQTTIPSDLGQADDTTRGNPDNTQTVLTSGSTKLCWEWGTSAGNGTISSLGLTHTDTGSYGCGVVSTAQQSLSPFANIGCMSQSYSYGDNANCVLAINGNYAYNFYLVDSTTVHIYKTPINNSKFKLQGSSLKPLTDYTQMITATLTNSYGIESSGQCYYWFDFANSKLVLFGVPSSQGTTLYKDEIDLSNWNDQTATNSTITVTGAKLWKFAGKQSTWSPGGGHGYTLFPIPTQAIIHNGYLYVYGAEIYWNVADSMYRINLSNTADITTVDTTAMPLFTAVDWNDAWVKTNGKHTALGGLIVNDNYIINGNKVFPTASITTNYNVNHNYSICDRISSPVFGCNVSINNIAACKLYLATKYNLPNPVTKSSAQSLTITYELTEV